MKKYSNIRISLIIPILILFISPLVISCSEDEQITPKATDEELTISVEKVERVNGPG